MYNNRDDLFGPLGPSARPLADTIYRRIVGEVVTSVNGQKGDVTVDVPDVDESLSDTSPNPVQNRAVAAALAQKGSVQDAVDETVALTPDPGAWIVVRREAAQNTPLAFDADAPAKVVEVPAPVYRYDEFDRRWYWSVVDSHVPTDYPNDLFAYTDVDTLMRNPIASGLEQSPDADKLAWTAATQADGYGGPWAVYVAKRVRGGLNRHGLARLVDLPANLSEMADDINLEGRLAQLTNEVNNKQTRQTTLAGYGIQDAWIDGDDIIRLGSKALRPLTVANFDGLMQGHHMPDYMLPHIRSDWEESDSDSLAFIKGKPTTLAGYGITDAKIVDGTITLGQNTITPLTSHQDISGKADAATTLAGYGITDAKIESGTITLGQATMTPLTSHQELRYSLVTVQASTGEPFILPELFPVSFSAQGQQYTVNLEDRDLLYIQGDVVVFDVDFGGEPNPTPLFRVTNDGKFDSEWLGGDVQFGGVAPTANTTQVLGFTPTYALQDRAVNAVDLSGEQSAVTSIAFTAPAAVTGKARNFIVRVTLPAQSDAPQWSVSRTGETIDLENADGELPALTADTSAAATTLLYFTETAAGVFLVKGEAAKAVA